MRISRGITCTAVALMAVAAIAAPVAAHRGKGGGKKPMGTIASFDGTTLTVTTTSGDEVTGTVTEDTQIKKEHRGHHSRNGNPTKGSVQDLTAGTFVLRMKVEDDVVEKVRVRSAAPHDDGGCSDDEATEEESTEDESTDETEATEEEAETDSSDDATDSTRLSSDEEGTESDDCSTDEDESTDDEADTTEDESDTTEEESTDGEEGGDTEA